MTAIVTFLLNITMPSGTPPLKHNLCVVCHSNMNRSMEGHNVLLKEGRKCLLKGNTGNES